eukprot:CAMPEP_0181235568 /NCGR_PEP_ID=MMETSP1096-20121128/37650_1 /TAXON_ID=156174 ORGANISM="Chrysochromulina ericina, Strain CCMP281" /NCGR_SAMPLE_ID=MMETSP1096 /ASSEMBLY_ACC=CAM_ASM_000453 /LENGTH=160 /DNA_ID=CAMNT_0023330567 /DNA_START=128 /DNA_END=608 /DNA_ORIENTATION=+
MAIPTRQRPHFAGGAHGSTRGLAAPGWLARRNSGSPPRARAAQTKDSRRWRCTKSGTGWWAPGSRKNAARIGAPTGPRARQGTLTHNWGGDEPARPAEEWDLLHEQLAPLPASHRTLQDNRCTLYFHQVLPVCGDEPSRLSLQRPLKQAEIARPLLSHQT